MYFSKKIFWTKTSQSYKFANKEIKIEIGLVFFTIFPCFKSSGGLFFCFALNYKLRKVWISIWSLQMKYELQNINTKLQLLTLLIKLNLLLILLLCASV